MARCCNKGCNCKIEAGANVILTGIGSSADPFILSTDVHLQVLDSDTIDLILLGEGTTTSPWTLAAGFAATMQLGDIPDVAAGTPTNGQVLGWDSTLGQWTPRAPTTAASGSVLHDTSLTGDGSSGSPLQVVEDPTGGLTTRATGLGLTDATKVRLVRNFTDAASRNAALPTPEINSLVTMTSEPGRIFYWSGSEWLPKRDAVSVQGAGEQLLALSGGYTANAAVTMLVHNFTTTTASDGSAVVLPNAMISVRAGVLAATITVTGSQPYHATLVPLTNQLGIIARRLDDGAVLGGQSISGQIIAYVY